MFALLKEKWGLADSFEWSCRYSKLCLVKEGLYFFRMAPRMGMSPLTAGYREIGFSFL